MVKNNNTAWHAIRINHEAYATIRLMKAQAAFDGKEQKTNQLASELILKGAKK